MKKIIIITIAALLVITALAKWEKNKEIKEQKTKNSEQKIVASVSQQKKIKVAAKLVKSKTETNQAELRIVFKPDDEAVSLGTFSLKLSLKPQGGGKLSLGEMALSEKAVAAGWSFPLSGYQVEANDSLTIKLSGALISKDPYLIDSEMVLAVIPISGPKISFSSVSMDDSVTMFFDPRHEVINVDIEPKVINE